MLRELSVQNLALIEDVRVELQPGFCVWTGETGAGKSLLLGAVGLLLGERGSAELLRSGADELRVTGRFELSVHTRKEVEEVLDRPLDEDEVILARRLGQNGRSYAYIDEQPISVTTLRHIGRLLVDLHGQRETESLLDPAYQLQLLDAFGNLQKQRQNYLDAAREVRQLRQRFRKLSEQRQQRQRELALLRFEREELDQAKLEPGELDELSRERERLLNAQNLQSFANQGHAVLYEDDGSLVEQIAKLQREADGWVALDESLAEVVARFESLQTEAQDLAQTLKQLGQRWEADPERLEEVERRLTLLRQLESKYRKSIDDLILYRVELDAQESRLQQEEDDLESIETELRQAYEGLRKSASELTRKRTSVARKLAKETQRELADLGMTEAKLEASLLPIPLGEDPTSADIPAWGAEQLELTLAANPGEPARPLRKVASGGELSRTMLALKTVLAGHDRMGTLIFDEIDSNVGGRLGDILGQKLAGLGRTHQVICVTHLPQVASFSQHHWSIRKHQREGRTQTQITPLEEGDRLEELASMMRGDARGETTRKEAKAMLESARQMTTQPSTKSRKKKI